MTQEPAERLHHPYSPSTLQTREASPHWTPKENSSSPAAERGTRQHDAAEQHIDLDDPELEDHEAEAVRMCKLYRDDIIAKYPGGTVIVEEYLPIDDEILVVDGKEWHGTTAGYVDLAVVSADNRTAEICDWKFGQWAVEPAENNLQGIAYMLGLVRKLPTLEAVTVHFCMPHRNEIDWHTFTRDEFPALYLRVVNVVQRAHKARTGQSSVRCTVTVPSCLFCGALGRCKFLDEYALKVGHKYDPLRVPENVTPSLFTDPASSKVVMGVAQLMEAWGRAVRAQITQKSIEADEWMPEGYVLRSRSDNDIKDWKAVLKTARKFGLRGPQLREALTVRITPLNKAISDASPRGSKKSAMEAFKQELLESGALEAQPPVYFLERLKS